MRKVLTNFNAPAKVFVESNWKRRARTWLRKNNLRHDKDTVNSLGALMQKYYDDGVSEGWTEATREYD